LRVLVNNWKYLGALTILSAESILKMHLTIERKEDCGVEEKNCTMCEYSCPLDAPRCFKGELLLRVHQDDGADENFRKDTLLKFMRFYGRILHRWSGGNDGQRRILRILSRHESVTQNDLQRALDIRPGSMSEIVSKLEAKGFIRRSKDETDKRRVVLSITDAGREAYVAEREESDVKSRVILDVLTPEEEKQLMDIYLKLLPGLGRSGPKKEK